MLMHNLVIAWKSLKRNRILSSLIVTGIALGIALSTTFATIRHSFAKDPIPEKSNVLYNVRLDSWDPLKPYPARVPGEPPTQITYRDAMEIMKSSIPLRQSAMYKTNLYVHPDPKVGKPFKEQIRACFADFFPMFNVPFKYGSGWDKKGDVGPEAVVVLNEEMNEKLFGGANSVGKTVRIEDKDFRVVGVLGPWFPSIKFYDLTQNQLQPPEKLFIPFNHLVPMNLRTGGNSDGWGPSPNLPGIAGLLGSETCWLQMWVELPKKSDLSAYQDFLKAYAMEQKKIGRFPRPVNNRVSSVKEWMDLAGVVPAQANALVVVSLLFLAVCALNLVGLLLGKFLARAAEIGVRRALGASRLDIFLQHVVECELIGVLGGVLGISLSLLTLAYMNNWMKTLVNRTDFFKLDAEMVVMAVGLSLAAGLVAGLYPAWRTCKLAPAIHLKVQ
ncbi:MAG: ABC transporter permease [Thermoanaerobaculia bacterium]